MTINSTQEHLQKYADAVRRLPGVKSAEIDKMSNTWEWTMDVVTTSKDKTRFIDNIISDRIEGMMVNVRNASGKGNYVKPGDDFAAPAEGNFEKVMKKYGEALRLLPGVVGVTSASIPVGPLTPAFRRALMVLTDSEESQRFLQNLVEKKIEGEDLVVRREKVPYDKYPSPEIGMQPLSREKQNEIRSMLNQYPAGVVMREDGNLFPVRSCSKDMKNNCNLSVTLNPNDKFQVFFEERHTAEINHNWRLARENDGIRFIGKEEYPGDYPGGPVLTGFTFSIDKPHSHTAMPIKFEKVAKGWCGNDPGTVIGTTTVSVHMPEMLNPHLDQ